MCDDHYATEPGPWPDVLGDEPMRLRGLILGLLLAAATAHATNIDVLWTPAPVPTLNGVVQPYTDFRLWRCMNTVANCPETNPALWSVIDVFGATAACAQSPCQAPIVELAPPGSTVTWSYTMTARAGGQESALTDVPAIPLTLTGADVPLKGPTNLQLNFAALPSDAKLAKVVITTQRQILLAKGETVTLNAPTLIVPVTDRRALVAR